MGKCIICNLEMTEYISYNEINQIKIATNKRIYMCEKCGRIYLPENVRNTKVTEYGYINGLLVPNKDTITENQMLFLKSLIKELKTEDTIKLQKTLNKNEIKILIMARTDICNLSKTEASKLISILKNYYDEKKKKYKEVFGHKILLLESKNKTSIWIYGFADAEITDKKWLEEYKNKLHPNDDWTDVNLETYGRWLYKINDKERKELINEALKANVVGFLEQRQLKGQLKEQK